jgi:peptidoglycan/LPS O-acetylase OafA/YrhL
MSVATPLLEGSIPPPERASGSPSPSRPPLPSHADGDPSWLRRGRIPCLDGLRAISILIVLFGHAGGTQGFPRRLGRVLDQRGALGVDVFFAISGFLITLLLMREWGKTNTISIKGFYIRRTLRIIPAFAAFLLAMAVAGQMGWVTIPAADWLFSLTYTMNFATEPGWDLRHMWSLSIEEQFYVAWPLTMLLLGPRRAKWAVVGTLLAAPLFRLATYLFLPQYLSEANKWTPLRIDYIAAGCVLALLAMEGNPLLRSAASRPGWTIPLLFASTCGLLVSIFLVQKSSLFKWSVGFSLKAVFIAAIIWICANASRSLVGRLLESRPLVFLGVLSYSLYLWQQPLFNPEQSAWPCRWPANLLLVLGIALASYYLIERPFLRLKDRAAPDRPFSDHPGIEMTPQFVPNRT